MIIVLWNNEYVNNTFHNGSLRTHHRFILGPQVRPLSISAARHQIYIPYLYTYGIRRKALGAPSLQRFEEVICVWHMVSTENIALFAR